MINITIDKEVWLVHTIMQVIWCKSTQLCASCDILVIKYILR